MTNYDMLLELLWFAWCAFGALSLVVHFLPMKIVNMIGYDAHDNIVNILLAGCIMFFMEWAILSGLDHFVFSK